MFAPGSSGDSMNSARCDVSATDARSSNARRDSPFRWSLPALGAPLLCDQRSNPGHCWPGCRHARLGMLIADRRAARPPVPAGPTSSHIETQHAGSLGPNEPAILLECSRGGVHSCHPNPLRYALRLGRQTEDAKGCLLCVTEFAGSEVRFVVSISELADNLRIFRGCANLGAEGGVWAELLR